MKLTRRLTLELRMVVEADDDRALQPIVQEAFREFLRVHIGRGKSVPMEHTERFMDNRGVLTWKATNEYFDNSNPDRPVLVEP